MECGRSLANLTRLQAESIVTRKRGELGTEHFFNYVHLKMMCILSDRAFMRSMNYIKLGLSDDEIMEK